ncbi:MAG: DNA polymerase I [Roseburia sp.]|nr:DNA polymerase I [Roseburia sp.]
MEKLVLIDGNSLLNRAFYATPVFSTSSGQPTNAIFGFTKLILKIISDVNPEYFVVTFDLKAPTFRHKMFDGYKATRSPMPDELASQVKPLKSLLSAMKIAMCEQEGVEADDLIGTLSNKFNVHSYIYTGDRDSFQLVDEKTDVYYTKRGVSDLLKLSCDNFESEIGLKPRAIIDLKALMGDKSDNIPGVSGIGETSARKLLSEYGTLDNIYENLDGISSPSLRKKLTEGRESAYMSYTLATIKRDCEIDLALENCLTPKTYSEEVKELFKTFEFKSLISAMNFESGGVSSSSVAYPEIVGVETAEKFRDVCTQTETFYIDFTENGGKIFVNGTLYEVKFDADDLFCKFPYTQFIANLKLIFENADNKVILYDYKKFLHGFGNGMDVKCAVDDIAVMHYLCDYFNESKSAAELCSSKGYDGKYSAYAFSLIFKEYSETLENDGVAHLYFDIEKPLIGVLYDMENSGVRVDSAQLDALGAAYSEKINELREKIYELCDCYFNINSPTQLGEVLFNKLGLKSGKKNKSGKYSTSADILESLADESEAVRLILSYRMYQKLYSTYAEGLKPLIDKKTQLIHTTFNNMITTTGRLSSTNPNLQNIPVREDEGREIRKVFIPHEGNILLDADYSQIELRLLAHFSGCKELVAAYNNDEDVHAVTASQVFGVPLSEVTAKMRRAAKAVNFGIIYGISEFGLSKNIGVDIKTAKEYIEKYFGHYSAVKEYMEANVEFARKNGYVATLTGRKRYIKEINSSNYNMRQFGERAAMNMPLQGSSADIIKIAMVNIFNKLNEKGMKTKLILQVHDELILDAPENEREQAAEILKYEMENAVKLKVPLKVEVHCGKNWYEAK